MPFSERAKTIALAIVKIFETGKPFGDYSAVAVLDDGAGISYGTSQFTHKSGSLWKVLNRYLTLSGTMPAVVVDAMNDFKSGKNILKHSNNKTLRTTLKTLGKEPMMQRAQREIAFENYLKPSIEAAEGSDFVKPLSLAVIYDSINHGSYAKIRDKVQLELPASIKPLQYEKEWITQYTKKRDAWLESIPRLAKTDYRTDFFLAQIARDNWDLNLPLNVHGFKLTEDILFPASAAVSQSTSSTSAEPTEKPLVEPTDQPPDFTEGERPIHIDNIENVEKLDAPPAPDSKPARVTVERTNIWAKIGLVVAAITGMGINIGNIINTKLNEMTIPQLGYALGGAAIIGVALWLYDRSAKRAHEKTLAKMATAADTSKTTVELREWVKK